MKKGLLYFFVLTLLIAPWFTVHAAKLKVHKNVFELKNVKVGDRVAGMRILSMKPLLENIVLPPGVSLPPEHNIQIKFSGKATVTGAYHYYDDDRPFGLGGNVCFEELNKASLRKIPKLKTDGRSVWFCFTNQKQARKLFGKKGSSGKATIVIDKYVINSAETEVHNVATLVKLIRSVRTRTDITTQDLLGTSWSSSDREFEISFDDDIDASGWYVLRTYLHARPEFVGTWLVQEGAVLTRFDGGLREEIYKKAVITKDTLTLYPKNSKELVEKYKKIK